MRSLTHSRWWLALALVLLVAPTGCLFSPDEDAKPPPPNKPKYEFPDTEDVLMANFREAYSKMDLDGYRDVLHPDFRFMFQQLDIEHLGLPSDHWTREEELLSANKMFNGLGPTPISKINIDVMDPQTPWQDTGSGHPDFPDSRRRVYAISMEITRPGDTTLMVTGLQEFFAVSRDSVVSGATVPYWELYGQIDRTEGAGS
jgi:hypothetical protein